MIQSEEKNKKYTEDNFIVPYTDDKIDTSTILEGGWGKKKTPKPTVEPKPTSTPKPLDLTQRLSPRLGNEGRTKAENKKEAQREIEQQKQINAMEKRLANQSKAFENTLKAQEAKEAKAKRKEKRRKAKEKKKKKDFDSRKLQLEKLKIGIDPVKIQELSKIEDQSARRKELRMLMEANVSEKYKTDVDINKAIADTLPKSLQRNMPGWKGLDLSQKQKILSHYLRDMNDKGTFNNDLKHIDKQTKHVFDQMVVPKKFDTMMTKDEYAKYEEIKQGAASKLGKQADALLESGNKFGSNQNPMDPQRTTPLNSKNPTQNAQKTAHQKQTEAIKDGIEKRSDKSEYETQKEKLEEQIRNLNQQSEINQNIDFIKKFKIENIDTQKIINKVKISQLTKELKKATNDSTRSSKANEIVNIQKQNAEISRYEELMKKYDVDVKDKNNLQTKLEEEKNKLQQDRKNAEIALDKLKEANPDKEFKVDEFKDGLSKQEKNLKLLEDNSKTAIEKLNGDIKELTDKLEFNKLKNANSKAIKDIQNDIDLYRKQIKVEEIKLNEIGNFGIKKIKTNMMNTLKQEGLDTKELTKIMDKVLEQSGKIDGFDIQEKMKSYENAIKSAVVKRQQELNTNSFKTDLKEKIATKTATKNATKRFRLLEKRKLSKEIKAEEKKLKLMNANLNKDKTKGKKSISFLRKGEGLKKDIQDLNKEIAKQKKTNPNTNTTVLERRRNDLKKQLSNIRSNELSTKSDEYDAKGKLKQIFSNKSDIRKKQRQLDKNVKELIAKKEEINKQLVGNNLNITPQKKRQLEVELKELDNSIKKTNDKILSTMTRKEILNRIGKMEDVTRKEQYKTALAGRTIDKVINLDKISSTDRKYLGKVNLSKLQITNKSKNKIKKLKEDFNSSVVEKLLNKNQKLKKRGKILRKFTRSKSQQKKIMNKLGNFNTNILKQVQTEGVKKIEEQKKESDERKKKQEEQKRRDNEFKTYQQQEKTKAQEKKKAAQEKKKVNKQSSSINKQVTKTQKARNMLNAEVKRMRGMKENTTKKEEYNKKVSKLEKIEQQLSNQKQLQQDLKTSTTTQEKQKLLDNKKKQNNLDKIEKQKQKLLDTIISKSRKAGINNARIDNYYLKETKTGKKLDAKLEKLQEAQKQLQKELLPTSSQIGGNLPKRLHPKKKYSKKAYQLSKSKNRTKKQLI